MGIVSSLMGRSVKRCVILICVPPSLVHFSDQTKPFLRFRVRQRGRTGRLRLQFKGEVAPEKEIPAAP